jgi:hypothetical protein
MHARLALAVIAAVAHATAVVLAQAPPSPASYSLVARVGELQKQLDEVRAITALFRLETGVLTLQRGISLLVAEGNIVVGSDNRLAEGSRNNIVAGSNLVVQGSGNIIAGADSTVSGLYNLVVGKSLRVSGGSSNVASGYANIVTGSLSVLLGGQVRARVFSFSFGAAVRSLSRSLTRTLSPFCCACIVRFFCRTTRLRETPVSLWVALSTTCRTATGTFCIPGNTHTQ